MDTRCAISSGVNVVSAVPSALDPCRREVPAVWQQASTRVVFPAPPCPTTTTLRIRSVVKDGADAILHLLVGCGGYRGGGDAKLPGRTTIRQAFSSAARAQRTGFRRLQETYGGGVPRVVLIVRIACRRRRRRRAKQAGG